MKKVLLLVSLIVPAILIANFASVLGDKLSSPIISWSPKLIEEKISPSDTSEINVIFESKRDSQNIELWLTPELKDFITFTPEYFDSVSAGTKNFIHLEILVPAETPFGTYNGTLHIKVGKRTAPQTLKITIKVIESLSEENLTTMLETHKKAAWNFNEWLEIYGREEAHQMTIDWLKIQNNVQETGISDDGTIWILFTNGIEGDIETYPSGTLGGNEGNNLISPSGIQKVVNQINAAVFSGLISQPLIVSNQPIVVGNDRVIVLDPFLEELGEESPQSYVYLKISPLTDATYLKNEEVTIDVIKTIYGYGVVNITTHGRLHRDVVGFLSGEKVTPINIFFHIGDLKNKRLSIGWHGHTPYYEILPAFITNYTKKPYPKSLIYIGACQSLKNSTMADAFLNREAATYFGFTRTTSALFNREKAKELFTSLVDNRQTTGEAFTDGLDSYWPGPDPEYGYESEPAKFDMVGESNLALLLPPPLVESPWPMFHHDIQHTGQSPYLGTQTSNIKWSFQTPQNISSSPVIGIDGTIFIGSRDGKLYAINPDGTLKWTYNTSYAVFSTPSIGFDGTVYLKAADKLYAINPDGTSKWEYSLWGNSSPTIGRDGTIYIQSSLWEPGKLYAINPNGTLKWSYAVGLMSTASSPAIGLDNTIYAAFGREIYAINPDGTLKWSHDLGYLAQVQASSPLLGPDGTIYVGTVVIDNKLYAINPDGTLKWSYTTGSSIQSSPAIGFDGTIYVGSFDKKLYAINPNGTLKWAYLTDGGVISSPAVDLDGTIYIGSRDRKFYAINHNGTLKWSFLTGRGILPYTDGVNSSPAIHADGTIYVGSDDGKLYAFGE